MGKLIGSGNTENFGEKLFIDKIQEYLDDTNIIYWNRQVFGREFDVCILMPEKGILVVELKGRRGLLLSSCCGFTKRYRFD